jgi:predicted amidohydrolase
LQAKRWHVVSDQTGIGGMIPVLGHSRVVDPQGRIVGDTGTTEGVAMWATDILIDTRTP